jgi:CRP/FNR family transcriptional regulator, cyclic AMP receptor protein
MVIKSLSVHPCFKTLDPESCGVLDRQCTWLKTPAGAWVVDQANNDRGVYFVLSGRLRAALQGARHDVVFTNIEAGSFFGELGALEGAPGSLSVFTVEDSTLARMPSAIFVHTMFNHRPLGGAVVATLVERNRAMTCRVAEAAHTYGSSHSSFSPTQKRPAQSCFDVGDTVRHISPSDRRARQW